MGRIMAIDYGQKRVGFAVTDELQICAHALETVPVAQAFDFLKDYLKKEKVDVIVIGEAKQLDNTPSESCRYIEPFVNRLRKELPNISPGTELARMDERDVQDRRRASERRFRCGIPLHPLFRILFQARSKQLHFRF